MTVDSPPSSISNASEILRKHKKEEEEEAKKEVRFDIPTSTTELEKEKVRKINKKLETPKLNNHLFQPAKCKALLLIANSAKISESFIKRSMA